MEKVTKHDRKLLFLRNNQAARVENCIIVFGGNFPSLRIILIYNIYAEKWGKFVIAGDEVVPDDTYMTIVQ